MDIQQHEYHSSKSSLEEALMTAVSLDAAEVSKVLLQSVNQSHHLPDGAPLSATKACILQSIFQDLGQHSVDRAMSYLKSFNSPPVRCGHVFAEGEPTYTCAECGVDPTCVLCHTCFMQSEHRNHHFSVQMSNSGGCCDCGDQEAWKGHAFCQTHQPHGEKEPIAAQALEKLSKNSQKHLYDAINFIIQSTPLTLFPQSTPDLSEHEKFFFLEPSSITNIFYLRCVNNISLFACILYNDEVHTFDEVIHQLRRAVSCDAELARIWANYVDVEGRAIVKIGSEAHCIKAAGKLTEIHLNCQVVSLITAAKQEVFTDLLLWLGTQAREVDALRAVICGSICNISFDNVINHNLEMQSLPPLQTFLLRLVELWKRARESIRAIIFGSVMLELDYKAVLAVIFTRNYGDIIAQQAHDDNDDQGGFGNISVQIFTVPSLARMLVQNENVLQVLLAKLREFLPVKRATGKLDCSKKVQPEAYHIITDIKYLLRNDVGSVLPMFPELIKILTLLQYMDPLKRQVGIHVLAFARLCASDLWISYRHERLDCQNAFRISYFIFQLLTHALQPNNLTDEDRICALHQLTDMLRVELLANKKYFTTLQRVSPESRMRIPNIVVEDSEISINHPIQSFITRLLCTIKDTSSIDFGNFFRCSDDQFDNISIILAYMEPALQTQVFMSQVRGNYWIRNGQEAFIRFTLYTSSLDREWYLETDLGTLQTACVVLGMKHFFELAIERFALREWLFSDDSKALSTGPKSFSQAIQSVRSMDDFQISATRIIGEIASARETSDGLIYTLKDEFLKEANNKHHYLQERASMTDLSYVTSRLKEANQTDIFFPSTCSIEFAPAFGDLYDIPSHPSIVDLATRCINMYCMQSQAKKSIPVEVVEIIINFIAMALNASDQHDPSKVVKSISTETPNGSFIAMLLQLQRHQEVPADLQPGIEWILSRALSCADESTHEHLVELGISKTTSSPDKGKKSHRKKRAGMKRQQLLSKFSKMQSNFNDIMKDGEAEGNNDSFEATSQEVATGRTDIKELASESDEDETLFFCIHCQENGDKRTEPFVLLGHFCHGPMLIPRKVPITATTPQSMATASVLQTSLPELEGRFQRLQKGQYSEHDSASDRSRDRTCDENVRRFIFGDAVDVEGDSSVESENAGILSQLLTGAMRFASAEQIVIPGSSGTKQSDDVDSSLQSEKDRSLRRLRHWRMLMTSVHDKYKLTKLPESTHPPELKPTSHIEWSKDGEIHFKTCGHAMHVQCFLQFFSHWKETTRLNVTIPDFKCPLCNSPSNAAIPQKASGISFKPLASPHESLHDVLLAAEVTRSVQFHFSTETTKGNTILHEIEQLADRKENDERCRASSTCVEDANFFFHADAVLRSLSPQEKKDIDLLDIWTSFGRTIVCTELAQVYHSDPTIAIQRKSIMALQSFFGFASRFGQVAKLNMPPVFRSWLALSIQLRFPPMLDISAEFEPFKVLLLFIATFTSIIPATTENPHVTPQPVPFSACVMISILWCLLCEISSKICHGSRQFNSMETTAVYDDNITGLHKNVTFPTVHILSTYQISEFQQSKAAELVLPRDLDTCLDQLDLPPMSSLLEPTLVPKEIDLLWQEHIILWMLKLNGNAWNFAISFQSLELIYGSYRDSSILVGVGTVCMTVPTSSLPYAKNDRSNPQLTRFLCSFFFKPKHFARNQPLFDPSSNYVQRNQGGCSKHCEECSAGTGLFLLIKHGHVLCLSSMGKGVVQPSPYVDEHGESNPGSHHNFRLFLSTTKYEQLQKDYREHNIIPAFHPGRELRAHWFLM
eukprot:gene7907-697_t